MSPRGASRRRRPVRRPGATPARASSLALLFLATMTCSGADRPTEPWLPCCADYPPQATSPYVLPYPVGVTEIVLQGNCSTGGHRIGMSFEHAYDFDTEIGDPVIAARAGTVVGIEEGFPDGNGVPVDNNYVFIEHADGTVARYYHLTKDGALVEPGDVVAQGDVIGLSGNTGNTGGLRHLHFDVATCTEVLTCPTLPVVFRNTRPHPNGLVESEAYMAESF